MPRHVLRAAWECFYQLWFRSTYQFPTYSISAAVLCHAVTLSFDPVTSTRIGYHVVKLTLSEIYQSAVELQMTDKVYSRGFSSLLPFFRAAVNAGRCSYERAVCLSVCQMCWLWQNRRHHQIFIPYERSLSVVFREEWLVGATPLPEILGRGFRWSEIADFQSIFVRSASE